MSERNQKFILLVVGVLVMSILVGYLVFAWTEPSQNPPGGNVPAPINVGNADQYKIGRMGVYTNGIDTNYGLTVGSATTPKGIKATGPSYFEGTLRITGTTTLATGSGNVGIGTTAPGEKLDVQGGGIKVGNFKIRPISGTELGLYDSGGNLILIFDQGI
jgi:hypothetical protein